MDFNLTIRKLTGALLILVIPTLFLLKVVFFNKTDVIVSAGIGMYKMLTFAFYFFTALIIGLFIFIMKRYFDFKNRTKEQAILDMKKKQDPLYEEEKVIADLEELEKTSSPSYKKYATHMLEQMYDAKNIERKFLKAVGDTDLPVIQTISEQIKSIQVHLLKDAKSVYRRILVEQGEDNIKNRLAKNDTLLKDAQPVIYEAINYLDLKTESNDLDLKSFAESLQELLTHI